MKLPRLGEVLLAGWPAERWRDQRVLLAVSGGADSVALLRLLAAAKAAVGGSGGLLVGHFNHRLRGAESDADEQFVVDLANRLALPVFVGHANAATQVESPSGTNEEAARQARYAFLQETCHRSGARYLVTGHTADDQAETVLLHLLRGTGPAGLAGMPRVRALGEAVSLVRPLLGVRRADLQEWLAEIGQPFRTDASNLLPRYRRNRLRHEVLPLLEEIQGEGAIPAIVRAADLVREAHDTLEALVDEDWPRCCLAVEANGLALSIPPLRARTPYFVREVLRLAWRTMSWPQQAMDAGHWEALAAIALAQGDPLPAARDFPGSIRATREPERLTLRRVAGP